MKHIVQQNILNKIEAFQLSLRLQNVYISLMWEFNISKHNADLLKDNPSVQTVNSSEHCSVKNYKKKFIKKCRL